MSDGITEARRGSYFNNKSKNVSTTGEVNHHQSYYDLDRNKPYKNTNSTGTEFKSVWVGDKKPSIEIDGQKIPDPRLHQIISFVKSGIRLVGYAFIPFDLVIATGVLILSEVIGIVEELV